MEELIFISAQPDEVYFHWQIEIYLSNFLRLGINPINIHTLIAIEDKPSNEILEIETRYNTSFFYYKKTDFNIHGYMPIVRPDIIYQHFVANEYLNSRNIFYHDSDIIFRELPNFDILLNDNVWYLSDTISYIGSNYIKSKGKDILKEMCRVADVDINLVESNNKNSGGAQYLLKNIDAVFWRDVLVRTLDIWVYLNKRECKDKFMLKGNLEGFNPIQKWCADMWGVLWTGLKMGYKIEIHNELNFSWGIDNKTRWVECKIYHNAGVVDNKEGTVFHKGEFHKKTPWLHDFSKIDKDSNTINYINEINIIKKERGL